MHYGYGQIRNRDLRTVSKARLVEGSGTRSVGYTLSYQADVRHPVKLNIFLKPACEQSRRLERNDLCASGCGQERKTSPYLRHCQRPQHSAEQIEKYILLQVFVLVVIKHPSTCSFADVNPEAKPAISHDGLETRDELRQPGSRTADKILTP